MKNIFAVVAFIMLFSSTTVALAGYPPSVPNNHDNQKIPLPESAYLGNDIVPLGKKERRALAQSRQWAGGGAAPYMGAGGKLLYMHGASLPTIIGSPMHVVDVELQEGEVLHEIIVGDSARWMVETGKAGNTPHLFIKPVDAGLESSAVVTTNQRVYHLRLISQRKGHTPYIAFLYADNLRREAKIQQTRQEKAQKWATNAEGVDLSKLNFNYSVKGKASWKPERVYDDGQQTFIRLPKNTRSGEIPVFLVRKNGDNVLVNYRIKEQAMVVDGVFKHIVLVVGVGSDQEKVEVRQD